MNMVKSANPIFWLAKRWRGVLIAILAMFFVLGTSYLNYTTQKADYIKWVSPDETANYIFSKLYAQEGQISIYERYNILANDLIHPRSFWASYGNMRPMSFLGIILLYGNLAKLTGYQMIPYFTPMFGAIGLVFFYLLVKRLFDRDTALVAAFITAAFPVYYFYSSRSMFHNVLFMVCVVASLYFMQNLGSKTKKTEDKQLIIDWRGLIFSSLAGLSLGWAIATRTSELIWLGPAMLILWLLNIRRVAFTKVLVVAAFTLIAYTPVMLWNIKLYGSPLSMGYPQR
jgi:asparagine N-glycosylation enzyme membrane subunit Stt3